MRLVAAALILALAGCGFTPLYGLDQRGGPVTADLALVRLNPIAEALGQDLRQALRDRIHPRGQALQPRYDFWVDLRVERVEQGIRDDDTATRTVLTLAADFQLTEGRLERLRGTAEGVVTFNVLDNKYSTMASEQDALQRAVALVARDLAARLAVHFSGAAPIRD